MRGVTARSSRHNGSRERGAATGEERREKLTGVNIVHATGRLPMRRSMANRVLHKFGNLGNEMRGQQWARAQKKSSRPRVICWTGSARNQFSLRVRLVCGRARRGSCQMERGRPGYSRLSQTLRP
jgi:hypothetical protein